MNTERIEKYILNQMSTEEKSAFERELASDPELQKELKSQQQVMEAIERTAIRTGIQKAIKTSSLKKNITKGSIGLIVSAAIVIIGFLVYKNTKTGETTLRYATNESGTTEFADADKYLPSQLFTINNDEDTIIETKDGIIFAIPAHAFKNAYGTEATGNIDIEIKEALSTNDILKAGLTTKSNDELLETAGMFYFNARSGEKNLTLTKPVNASVPAADIKPDMKFFEGKRTADGTINWVNPVELDKDLKTYNITDLDFYPANYIPALQKLGLDYQNKKYTDSLYYSYSGYQVVYQGGKQVSRQVDTVIEDKTITRNVYNYERKPSDKKAGDIDTIIYGPNGGAQIFMLNAIASSNGVNATNVNTKYRKFKKTVYDYIDSISNDYEIDPSRIHAIWNEKFNNTILATKEFEERLKYIQSSCSFLETRNIDAFNVYVNHLDKPLYYSDSILASQLNVYSKDYKFEEFYKRHDGGVKISSSLNQKLSHYFQKRSETLRQIAQKTWKKIFEGEAKKEFEAQQQKDIHEYLENKRNSKVFIEEYDKNLEEARVQYSKTAIVTNYYNISFRNVGWGNIDGLVYAATLTRTTLKYEDNITGGKIEIKYSPLTVSVNGEYDRTLVYMIPRELTSFQRLKQEGKVFKESLNGFLKYDLVAIGYKDGNIFYHMENDITPTNYTFDLEPIKQDELTAKLWKLGKDKRNDMRVEVAYEVFMEKEAERKKIQLVMEEQRKVIAHSIFPCLQDAAVLDTAKYENYKVPY